MTDPSTPPPQSIGPYEVLAKLGEGGMGSVYKGFDPSLGRNVALKVLSPILAKDDEARQRFVREARAAAVLSHPNVAQVYQIGDDAGHPFIAMEYVEGSSVEDLLRRGKLSPADALSYVLQVVDGLEAAWRKGIVHRDIKPANVLVHAEGYAKIVDFGLSKVYGADKSLTQTGMVMGTPRYMSPEQGEGKPLDFRSDIYSLGASLYHMLVGTPPYDADTPVSVIVKHITSPVPSLHSIDPTLPAAVCRVIEKMLQKKPDDRHQSYDEVRSDLRVALEAVTGAPAPTVRPGRSGAISSESTVVAVPVGAEAPTVSLRAAAPPVAVPRRRRWRRVLGIVAVIFLLLVVADRAKKKRQASPPSAEAPPPATETAPPSPPVDASLPPPAGTPEPVTSPAPTPTTPPEPAILKPPASVPAPVPPLPPVAGAKTPEPIPEPPPPPSPPRGADQILQEAWLALGAGNIAAARAIADELERCLMTGVCHRDAIPSGKVLIGSLYAREGKVEPAIAQFREALHITRDPARPVIVAGDGGPRFVPLYQAISQALTPLNLSKEHALSLVPTFEGPEEQLAFAETVAGLPKGEREQVTIAAFEKVMRQYPDDLPAYLRAATVLSVSYLRSHLAPRAIEHLERVVAHLRGRHTPWEEMNDQLFLLTCAYLEGRDIERARESMKEAVHVSAANPMDPVPVVLPDGRLERVPLEHARKLAFLKALFPGQPREPRDRPERPPFRPRDPRRDPGV